MSNIQKTLNDIEDTLNKAFVYSEIWWTLDHTGIKKHYDSMNEFSIFFESTITAHYQCMFVSLSRLFDRADDLSGIKKLKSLLIDSSRDELVNLIDIKLAPHLPVIRSIKGIRDQSIAHKKGTKDIEQVYSENHVTPNQIRGLIKELIKTLRVVYKSIGYNLSITTTNRYELSTLGLLQSLEQNMPSKQD